MRESPPSVSGAAPANSSRVDEADDPPPGGWRTLYAFVIAALAIDIALLALLGRIGR